MSLEDLKHISGNDHIIELLKELGQPVTRENYLAGSPATRRGPV